MRVAGGRRAGRSHRKHDLPCQDAYATWRAPDGSRVAAAVADGLGSRELSHVGSRAACQMAVLRLSQEPEWDEEAMRRAFEAARHGVEFAAAQHHVDAADMAATLQIAALDGDRAVGGIVGDGAVIACGDGVEVLLPPEESEYANEVVPVTNRKWERHFRFARTEAADCALVFTDGLTRLLLTRSPDGWQPFGPFFDAFLPKVRAEAFEEDLVERFLSSDHVDASWDDDKCLVVVGRDR